MFIGFLYNVVRSCILRKKYHELDSTEPISVERLLEISAKYCHSDPLLPVTFSGGAENGYQGIHPELKEVFDGVTLGTWAINSKTIDLIWSCLDDIKPSQILEFGSGCSTCVFAAWMRLNRPDGRILSIDQNAWAADSTTKLLKGNGLSDYVNIVVMEQDRNGRYVIDCDKLKGCLANVSVDLVFVDGPAGSPGCRDNTLPSVLPILSQKADWFLHDALRRDELETLCEWSRIEGVDVSGVLPYGSGIAIGRWNSSHS